MAPAQVDEPLLSLDNGIKNYSSLFPWDTVHKVHVIRGKKVILKTFTIMLYNAPLQWNGRHTFHFIIVSLYIHSPI